MTAYATTAQVEAGFRSLSDDEKTKCEALLDEAAVLIDSVARYASADKKRVVSCRLVRRAIGDDTGISTPIGATQTSMSGLGYSQTYSFGNGGSGEMYLTKTDRSMLGIGNKIGFSNPYAEGMHD